MDVALGLLALSLIVALVVAARAALTVCVLEVVDGTIRVARGRIAPAILRDLGDVVRRPSVARAEIRITRASGRAEVRFRGGVGPDQAQRVRNVIGSVPLAKLVNAG